VKKTEVALKCDKNNGTSHEDQYTFLSYLAHSSLEREMFQTKVEEKIKTQI